MYKDLDEVSPRDEWFPFKYIDAEANNKLDETKGRLTGNEIEKESKHHVESINHDPNWLNIINIEIDNFLINR